MRANLYAATRRTRRTALLPFLPTSAQLMYSRTLVLRHKESAELQFIIFTFPPNLPLRKGGFRLESHLQYLQSLSGDRAYAIPLTPPFDKCV